MCFGSKASAAPMPSVPPAAPTMADPAVQAARQGVQNTAAAGTGLAETQLTTSLGGTGAGVKKTGQTK